MKSQSVYTDANIVGFEKINQMKGEQIELEKVRHTLQSELDGLRNIKDEQFRQLESIAEVKNYPVKLRELFDALKTLRVEQKGIEDNIKVTQNLKKSNFEQIIKLEDELKDLKRIRKEKKEQQMDY